VNEADIRNWFAFHPPTGRADADRHAAIRAAEETCWSALLEFHLGDHSHGQMGGTTADDEQRRHLRFLAVSEELLTYALVINAASEDCPDKTAALRCIRLARTLANEVLLIQRRRTKDGVDEHEEIRMLGEVQMLRRWVKQQLRFARYQASQAVVFSPVRAVTP
jgi:hypothetical protein